MEIVRVSDPAIQELMRTMFARRNLVLVCGAGFSRGAPSRGGVVPDGEGLRQIMLRSLKENVGDEADELTSLSFQEVSEHFLNPEFVPTEKTKEIISDLFTGVSLPEPQTKFLSCPWPYIYTLNIDDAIERNSEYKVKILPNRKMADGALKSFPCVLKIHGDATEELVYDEPSKIIFSTGQYVRSLTTNQSMLNSIKTDLIENNIIFVGCSLDNEVDLLYALAEYQGKFPEARKSVYVTRKEPKTFTKAKLKKHGINTVLIVDSYDEFYTTMAFLGGANSPASNPNLTLLKTSEIPNLGSDRQKNQHFLLQDPSFSEYEGLPYYYIERDIEDSITRSTGDNPITLLRGRRFSGRTLMLRRIAQAAKARNVYLFNSRSSVSEEVVNQLSSIKNGLLIFDTNALTPKAAYLLGREIDKFKANKTSLIIAVNRTEPEISGALIRYIPESADFDLDNRLSTAETSKINTKLDELGLLQFKKNKTFLENTFELIKKYKTYTSTLTSARSVNDAEMELLLVIAIAEKAHSSLATALGMRTDHIYELCERFAPIIDRAETSRAEFRDTGSKYKVIANSRLGLSYQIAHAVEKNGLSWISERIESVVENLLALPRFRQIANSMFMFDAINHVLGQASLGSERTGYKPVVRRVYEGLQPILSSSPDYWLQRAKATLNIDDDEKSLIAGIEFALKAYDEAERHKTIDNAEFSIALLYGKLCWATGYKKQQYISSAVEWFAKAVRNYSRNPDYVQRIFDDSRQRRGWFTQLCDHLEGPITEAQLLPLKGDIQFLLTARRRWRRS